MIEWTEEHQQVWKEYGLIIGVGFDQQRAKNKNNKGALHRLRHLVPSVVATQERLAFILAELALEQVHDRMHASCDALANELLEEAKAEELNGRNGFERLAELVNSGEKWLRPAAYDACILLTEDRHRCVIKRDVLGGATKAVDPIPTPVEWLLKFGIKRPNRPRGRDPAKTPFFDGGVVLMIHMASESALKPLQNKHKKKPTVACSDVVVEVLHKYGVDKRFRDAIQDVWERRSKNYPSDLKLLPPKK